jgi:hypothetical protein
MENYADIEQRVTDLLERRGIAGHTAADRFVSDFKAYLVYFSAIGVGSADTTLGLLEDDSNLTDSKILKTNFKKRLGDLISPALRADQIFPRLFKILLDNKGKGVGAGELALPLILKGYKFSNDSDGVLDSGAKVEIKKNGASLKPIKTGVTEKGLVDKLNDRFFKGTIPGKKSDKLFKKHLETVKDPAVYGSYFTELYPGCDVTALTEEVVSNYRDPQKFNTAVGRFALKQYQKVDGWQNIIFIDGEKQLVVNIADPDKIDGLNLTFSPVLARRKDTQAIADGYVNVSF